MIERLIIDADSMFYRIGWNPDATKSQLKMRYRKFIKDTMHHFFVDRDQTAVLVKGDPSKEFRYQIYPEYKQKRGKDMDEDFKQRVKFLYEYSLELGAIPAAEPMETDDMAQVYAHTLWHEGTSYAIAHIDKDLNMIPGLHYNYVKGEEYEVDLDAARRHFFWQLLVGDSVDNIPGVKGIGPKRADAILDNCHPEYWYRAVRSKWDSRSAMDISARCLFMGHPDTFTYDLRTMYAQEEGESQTDLESVSDMDQEG